ncbi:sensor histidine kinase [Arcanobacterium hippocoleae]|uniref:histidine kinase n=1 Tax=Arcanobacterium hippocoleae TaxID=149017 RepID=A0ABU1T1L0_9ACTO|nr:histidine kinase [Arcanobacterium hippocoleae]MDR6939208.1 signal transduction histidine kinase [Arcanobacterium hippocoleae]
MNLEQKLQLKRAQFPVDVLFALLAFVLWLLSFHAVSAWLTPLGNITIILAGIFSCFAFALRSGFPNTSTFVIFSALLIRYLISPTFLLPADACLIFALYYVSVHGSVPARLASLIAALIGGALLSLPFFISQMTLNSTVILLLSETILLITALLGSLKRLRNEQLAALQRQEIASARNEIHNAEIAVAAERTRIAREMHDIVAHTLSVVITQADGGRYAAKANPQAAAAALENIAEMSRAALADIRSIIGVLRDPKESAQQLRPQPIGTDIAELISRIKDAGKEISYIRIGQPRSLPVGLGNALYRICQEALTNSMKHAGPNAAIAVILKWEENNISLEIIDDGRGAATKNDGHGHGLIGMRERAAVFGGTIEAGAKAQGGFRVKAVIPFPAETQQDSIKRVSSKYLQSQETSRGNKRPDEI